MTEAYSDGAAHIRSILSDIATPHASHTGERLANALPPLNIERPETNLFTSGTLTLDVSELVHLRFLHQTKQAETGVRKVGSGESIANRKAEKPLSERQQIIRKFAEILKQQDDRGVGTGLERSARWISKGSAESTSKQNEAIEKTSGNSANAAAVADATASSVRLHNLVVIYYLSPFLRHSPNERESSKMLVYLMLCGTAELIL